MSSADGGEAGMNVADNGDDNLRSSDHCYRGMKRWLYRTTFYHRQKRRRVYRFDTIINVVERFGIIRSVKVYNCLWDVERKIHLLLELVSSLSWKGRQTCLKGNSHRSPGWLWRCFNRRLDVRVSRRHCQERWTATKWERNVAFKFAAKESQLANRLKIVGTYSLRSRSVTAE